MFPKNPLVQASVYAFSLALGYGLGYLFSSNERTSFGAVSAWWMALYVGRIVDMRVATIAPVAIAYLAVLIIDTSLDFGWFYPEGASSSPIGYVALSMIGLVIIASPIVVNRVVSRFLVKT